MKIKNIRKFKQLAFVLSLFMLALWGIMGAGTSLAWFHDSSPELKNVFHVAEFKLDVSYRTEDLEWKPIQNDTELFDKDALYEPGYTQLAYIRVKNNGDIPFEWKTAISVYSYIPGINVFGTSFNLQDHLKFGLAIADTETRMDALVATRTLASQLATEPLNNYSTAAAYLAPGGEAYIALVVRMPEEVTNIANYRPPHQPKVYLGAIVSATQQHD
ncbi:MAG: hypothetical protein E7588_05885 [Ruminococcaceae bacterium]|nr:hypothetical protein [Oscillospiraceae bacterium]